MNKQLAINIYNLVDRTRISSMVIGGIGAFLIHKKNAFVYRVIFKISTQILSYLLLALILFNICSNTIFLFLKNELLSFLIAIIVLNISVNKKSILNLENKKLNFLGNISYGIYIYIIHLFVFFV